MTETILCGKCAKPKGKEITDCKCGRPTDYSKELATLICKRIAQGESVRKIEKDDNMPSGVTIYSWLLDEDKQEFLKQYESSRAIQAENMFEEINEIADDGRNDYMERENSDGNSYEVVNSEHIQRSRLRVDTRKWYLSKVLPKKFGEKLDLTTKDKEIPFPIISLDAILSNHSNNKDSEPNKEN